MSRPAAALSAALLALVVGTAAAAENGWQPAKGPLFTRWARDVSPEKVLPEYPRPQMVRSEWLNLNGLWDYAIVGKEAARPAAFQGKIPVPFPVESALSGVMKQVDEKSRVWYRRTFQVPKPWAGKKVLLHFEAVDWEATAWLNGRELGTHRGGYDGFSFDVTDALRPGGPQELVVAVFDPTQAGYPHGKQVHHPGGCAYTQATGIWRTVWLEPVPKASIDGLVITPDVDAGCLRLSVRGRGAGDDDARVEAVALAEGKQVGRAGGKVGQQIAIPVPKPRLWSPESPFLYDLKVSLVRGGQAVDAVTSYFGMRKIALGKDAKGVTRPMLNGKFVFQVGPLDQGFWPDGIYTAPTDEALRYDIEVTKRLGFNMTRKHVKIEPQRWYTWCDKLGLLVWQDMPSGENRTADNKEQFEAGLRRMVEEHRNHPSIIMWVVFNEGWGQFDTERLVGLVKGLDPSRLVSNATGGSDKGVGDVIDVHSYPGPACPKPEAHRAAMLGEFGGLGYRVEGHVWCEKSWGYRQMNGIPRLTRTYCTLLEKVYALKDSDGLNGVLALKAPDYTTDYEELEITPEARATLKPGKNVIAIHCRQTRGG